jgi:hypothetical protein
LPGTWEYGELIFLSIYLNLPKKQKVMGLERGPLSLVSITEELLDTKVAAPV